MLSLRPSSLCKALWKSTLATYVKNTASGVAQGYLLVSPINKSFKKRTTLSKLQQNVRMVIQKGANKKKTMFALKFFVCCVLKRRFHLTEPSWCICLSVFFRSLITQYTGSVYSKENWRCFKIRDPQLIAQHVYWAAMEPAEKNNIYILIGYNFTFGACVQY